MPQFILVACTCLLPIFAHADFDAQQWVHRFQYEPPLVSDEGVCEGTVGALPSFTVTPPGPGAHLVRVSLPFAPAALPDSMGLVATIGTTLVPVDVRPLTYHPGLPRSVRRGIATFPHEFTDHSPQHVSLTLAAQKPQESLADAVSEGTWRGTWNGVAIEVAPDAVSLTYGDGSVWNASLIAPARAENADPLAEVIEQGSHYLWVRLLAPDPHWPRIVEVQLDSLGTAVVQAHVQRLESGDGTAPDLGWDIHGPAVTESVSAAFTDGSPTTVRTADGHTVSFPVATLDRRGGVEGQNDANSGRIRFFRCRADENMPFQETAWRRAALVIGKSAHTPRTALLLPDISVNLSPDAFAPLYPLPPLPSLALWPVLDDLDRYHRDAIVRSMAVGDDAGNVTSFSEGSEHGGYYGMNRLNHNPAIFREAWRSGDGRLRDVAALWCGNMFDLSVWWGDKAFGGTRYNNAVAAGEKEHEGDTNFMWRTNWSSHFCTKGYDAFLYAYEETGDPRMLAALRAQVDYARTTIHTNTGEARNIGDVTDYMNLYRCTGVAMYRDEALRLFRELREKLSAGDLFSQGGQPIVEDGPFIDDDQHGYEAPFAKPYIIGYALAGLPDLLRECPDEPKLRDVVRAVADFMAESQDPVGGWRYPHPQSSGTIISQGMEHAAQVARAAAALEARGEDVGNLLNAIERVLQGRLKGFERTGTILAGLTGWERSTGLLDEDTSIYDLYEKPGDRDPSRDYTEGDVAIGSAPPEGLVYMQEVLAFYLAHRTAERLFHASDELAAVLNRVEDRRLKLTPQSAGSFLRIERPKDSAVGFTLWAPEWASFPPLGYGDDELGGMAIDWQRDESTAAVSYSIERPEGTFSATFTPHVDYVECLYTAWPNDPAIGAASFAVGPCQQMKDGVFEGNDADLMTRMWFLDGASWVPLASCTEGNARNVLYLQGHDSPEMTGAMAESGWKTVQGRRPTVGLIACVSPDGKWMAATVAEHATSICNNANASHRCMHSHGSLPLHRDSPTTLRVLVYLMPGTLDDLKARYEHHARRWNKTEPAPGRGLSRTMTYGVRAHLPSFHDARIARMKFPLAWRQTREGGRLARHSNAGGTPALPQSAFTAWRAAARDVYLASLQERPPLAPFAVQVLATEHRDGYEARKLAVNLSADSRVKAYLLVPDGPGPFPAVVALHDHGAHFSIGKEKVLRPFAEPDERLQDAQEWVNECYDARWFGDELAKRGYVVFATDALFWGDRGRAEGVKYEEQQALASNMFQLGVSWAGTIVWDDIRSAEFVQGLPEVDPERIACMGLSMGSNRAWHLAAATDIIKAGAAICWLGDTPTLMSEGNNQTVGQSAFSMLHPGLRNALDYADVASLACPKPMLFYNGTQDGLFPVPGVEAAYATMHDVWTSQRVDDNLETRLWPVPHVFNVDMQEAAFKWLECHLGKNGESDNK